MTGFTEKQFFEAFPEGIQFHFWNRSRNEAIANLLRQSFQNKEVLLEIGCGTGVVVQSLRDSGFNCFGAEISEAPVIPEISDYVFAGQDAFELAPEFRQNVRCVMLLDVLEHIEDPVLFLSKVRSSFPLLKLLIIMVPARSELWSNYDTYYGHFRRYDVPGLSQEMTAAGFRVIKVRYQFHLLYLAMRILLRLQSKRNTELAAPSKASRPIHFIISKLIRIEELVVPKTWFGSSIIATGLPEA